MRKNKRPTHSGNCERAEEIAVLQNTAFSINNITTEDKHEQGFIESLLPFGEQNAITSRELLKLTGYKDIRSMQTEIERERAAGALILSKCTEGGGYYLPHSRMEIVRYETTLRRRALSTLRTLKTARAALREIDGQQNMEALI